MVTQRVTILCEAQACKGEALDRNPKGYHGPLCAAKLRILLAQPSGDDQALCACMGKRAKDFKSKANIKFYYVKLRFPMRSLAAHTACAAFCFSKGNNQKHLCAAKQRILLAQPSLLKPKVRATKSILLAPSCF